jgi:hypothetical protein
MDKQIIWTTKKVEEATEKILDGFTLKRVENPFYENTIGLRRAGLTFQFTKEELEEYIKCKMDVHYFAENYCWVKGEQGEPVRLKLRDYQREILDNFFNNRFNILMASRQIGKCFSFNTNVKILDNNTVYDIRFGKLYYSLVSRYRKLTLLEKIKIKIYDIIYFLENT